MIFLLLIIFYSQAKPCIIFTNNKKTNTYSLIIKKLIDNKDVIQTDLDNHVIIHDKIQKDQQNDKQIIDDNEDNNEINIEKFGIQLKI